MVAAMTIPLSYSYRNLTTRLPSTLATTGGLMMMVFVLSAALMLASGVRRGMIESGSDDRAIVLQVDAFSEDGSRLKQSMMGLAAAAPGVAPSTAGTPLVAGESIVHLPFDALGSGGRIASLQVRGVSDGSLSLRPQVRLSRGRAARPGTAEAIVGAGLAGQYEGLELGGSFSLQKGRAVSVVGVFDAGGTAYDSEVWVDGDLLRSALGWQGSLSSVTAQLTSAQAFAPFAARLMADREQGLSVEPERAYYARIGSQLAGFITDLGWLITAVVSIGAALGAMITMDAAVAQRRREIGVLEALGFSQAQVFSALLVESGLLALVGSGLGVALALLTPLVDFTTTNAVTGQEVAFHFLPSASVVLGPWVFGTLIGLLGGAIPALRAARTDALVAMRD
jgi:putative ABC transport system permease protein